VRILSTLRPQPGVNALNAPRWWYLCVLRANIRTVGTENAVNAGQIAGSRVLVCPRQYVSQLAKNQSNRRQLKGVPGDCSLTGKEKTTIGIFLLDSTLAGLPRCVDGSGLNPINEARSLRAVWSLDWGFVAWWTSEVGGRAQLLETRPVAVDCGNRGKERAHTSHHPFYSKGERTGGKNENWKGPVTSSAGTGGPENQTRTMMDGGSRIPGCLPVLRLIGVKHRSPAVRLCGMCAARKTKFFFLLGPRLASLAPIAQRLALMGSHSVVDIAGSWDEEGHATRDTVSSQNGNYSDIETYKSSYRTTFLSDNLITWREVPGLSQKLCLCYQVGRSPQRPKLGLDSLSYVARVDDFAIWHTHLIKIRSDIAAATSKNHVRNQPIRYSATSTLTITRFRGSVDSDAFKVPGVDVTRQNAKTVFQSLLDQHRRVK